MHRARWLIAAFLLAFDAPAQVYSPKVLISGQPDASDLRSLAQGIYRNAGAHSPRERAEAIWRFFLTDGRFVEPGFWYHIAGWAYEEPRGEVLDPLRLLNSYGFGLCYQIAPVLEAVWKAGGFEDARVWFLTGHTVAEVYYDGGYHYFDSDMLGYNTVGRGPARASRVASVRELERDPSIIRAKLTGPKQVDTVAASEPWYPADVRAGAMEGLVQLFTSSDDNRVFPFERAPAGHTMDFVLRPGERLIRYFRPERAGLFYLPYKSTGSTWSEFPAEIAEYQIRTADGPRSQKDARSWATGAIEYHPRVSAAASSTYEVQSPWVIIDSEFRLDLALPPGQSVALETSTDDGRTWITAGELHGPHAGEWRAGPAILTRSEHGRRSAVSGTYHYLVKLTRSAGVALRDLSIVTRFQLNPRTLAELKPGHNELVYTSGTPRVRRSISVEPERVARNARYVSDGSQGYWIPSGDQAAEFIFHLAGGQPMASFDVGGRFLDLTSGLAPDKFTAEVRKVTPLAAKHPAASIAWSTMPDGEFHTVWQYDPRLTWKDGDAINRTLPWPEVDRRVQLGGERDVWVRYRIEDLAVDDFRLAVVTGVPASSTALEITHRWTENGVARNASQTISPGVTELHYTIDTPPDARITNDAIIFETKPPAR